MGLIVKTDETRFSECYQLLIPFYALKNGKGVRADPANLTFNYEGLVYEAFTLIVHDNVSGDDTCLPITQVEFADAQCVKHIGPRLVQDPYCAVVAQMASVVYVTDLDLDLVGELVAWPLA